MSDTPPSFAASRHWLLVGVFALTGLVLLGRAFELQVLQQDFLEDQGKVRQHRTVAVPAHRGRILDRNGEPLAVSAPVVSVWADPAELFADRSAWMALARDLDMSPEQMQRRLARAGDREFVYLKRHLTPAEGEAVLEKHYPGVALQREYRRYYPTAEVTAHLLGFTDIDDRGQEGLELAYDEWLRGVDGRRQLLQDRTGRFIADLGTLKSAESGRDLVVSLDRRLQYLVYRELKTAVTQHRAVGGSVVVLDVTNGELLAVANQPSYNPNRPRDRGAAQRNRAFTDVYEPGSTMKPLTIAAALESGTYEPLSRVPTSPGWMRVAGYTVRDHRDFGELDMTGVLRYSSNVGAGKIALKTGREALWQVFDGLGLGQISGSGFPGESGGLLTSPERWREAGLVTMAYGYGLSVTPLQLARAYAGLANDGWLAPISLLKRDRQPALTRVLKPATALSLRQMLTAVVDEGGTGWRARVQGYSVAGKTGTAHKAVAGGYAEDRYVALFAGFAPASHPRLAVVVVIDEPQGEAYFGGQVAAPVFAQVMAGGLRLLNVAPDDLKSAGPALVAAAGEDRP